MFAAAGLDAALTLFNGGAGTGASAANTDVVILFTDGVASAGDTILNADAVKASGMSCILGCVIPKSKLCCFDARCHSYDSRDRGWRGHC